MSQCKRLVAGIVFVASMAAMGVAFGGEDSKDLMQALGIHAFPPQVMVPDFTLKALGGKKVSLNEFRGKVVLLNFWATWCLPCQWEMPHLEQLYQA